MEANETALLFVQNDFVVFFAGNQLLLVFEYKPVTLYICGKLQGFHV